jgi:hypothetical protein
MPERGQILVVAGRSASGTLAMIDDALPVSRLSLAKTMGPGRCHDLGTTLRLLCLLRILPAWIRLLISPAADIIPRVFRIMETSAATARTLQGMARVRSGCTCMEAAWIVRFSAWSS